MRFSRESRHLLAFSPVACRVLVLETLQKKLRPNAKLKGKLPIAGMALSFLGFKVSPRCLAISSQS